MNALIIVAIVLVAVGLLITAILWLRTPDSAESEYVTVAELQARLEHEQEPGEPGELAERTGESDRAEAGESVAEPAKAADTDSATTVTSQDSIRSETGPRPAGKSTVDTDDEPEILTPPVPEAEDQQDSETGGEPLAEKPDRNH